MRLFPIQNRFTAGEISPKLWARSDIEGYAGGVSRLENFIAMRHGALERRGGFMGQSMHDGYRGRLFPFPVTDAVSYLVTFSDTGKMYVENRDGNYQGDEQLVNPQFTTSMDGWTAEANDSGNVSYIAGRVLLQTGAADQSSRASISQVISVSNPSEAHTLTLSAEAVVGAARARIKVGVTPLGDEILSAAIPQDREEVTFNIPTLIQNDLRYTSGGDQRETSFGDNIRIAGTAIYITIVVDNSAQYERLSAAGVDYLRDVTGDYISVQEVTTEETGWWIDRVSLRERDAPYTNIELDHPYSVNDLEQLQMAMVPGEEKAFFATGSVPPFELKLEDDVWFFSPIRFSGKPKEWTGIIDFKTTDGWAEPNIGDVVEVVATTTIPGGTLPPGFVVNGVEGNVYRYLGAETDLGATDYTGSLWTDLGLQDLLDKPAAYTTDDGSRYLSPKDTVYVAEGYAVGGTVKRVYQYSGNINLAVEQYLDLGEWVDVGTAQNYVLDLNFPSTVTFFEGRSWWAGFPRTRDKMNGSKSNDYYDLRLSDGFDADGIDITLDDHGLIQWIRGEQDLLIGSMNGEYILNSDENLITPSDVQANKQSANGSANMQAQAIGNSVAYTSLDGTKIRDMEYKFSSNGWQSMDVSFTAEHMFADWGRCKEIHFSKDPESILWLVTDKGYLIGCTFDPANQVIGWHRHPTEGKVISACIMKDKGKGELWVMVDRSVSGGDKKLSIEVMSEDASMDSGFTVFNTSITDEIVNISALANRTVSVKVDGVHVDDVTLDATGSGTASVSGWSVEVGLPFSAVMETLPTDVPVKGGSGYIHNSRWTRLWLRLYSSQIPMINDQLPSEHERDELEYSGLLNVVNLGWDLDSINKIEMSSPYRCRISGLFGELQENIV